MALPVIAMPVIIKWIALVSAGIGAGKVVDEYVKPLFPRRFQPETPLSPAPILSIRTVWLVAVSVIAAMLVIWVGKTLKIPMLTRKI